MQKQFSLCLIAAMFAALGAQAEVRLTMSEATKAAIEQPRPEYAPIARQMRVTGDVVVEAHINVKGSVDDVKVVSGNAMLTPPVVAAVKRWKFSPATENGAPAAAVATLKFIFSLN